MVRGLLPIRIPYYGGLCDVETDVEYRLEAGEVMDVDAATTWIVR